MGQGCVPATAAGRATIARSHPCGLPAAAAARSQQQHRPGRPCSSSNQPDVSVVDFATPGSRPGRFGRSEVVNHPGCPPDLIPGFAGDTSPLVRANTVKHPACPRALIEHAAHDPHAAVRVAVAESGRCATHLLERLIADEDKTVSDTAKRMLSQLD